MSSFFYFGFRWLVCATTFLPVGSWIPNYFGFLWLVCCSTWYVHLASDQSECWVSRSVGVLLPVSLPQFAVGFSCSAGSVETQWESCLQGTLMCKGAHEHDPGPTRRFDSMCTFDCARLDLVEITSFLCFLSGLFLLSMWNNETDSFCVTSFFTRHCLLFFPQKTTNPCSCVR